MGSGRKGGGRAVIGEPPCTIPLRRAEHGPAENRFKGSHEEKHEGETPGSQSIPVAGTMNKAVLIVLAIAACLFVFSEATQVQSCSGERGLKESDSITISGCNNPPCKLKKKTKVNVEFKFIPDSDVPKLENSVFAYVLGVPLPFIGVDSTSACTDIVEDESGRTGCPLKAGAKYTYKNSFDVLEVYPKIRTTVQWALREPTGKDHVCFKVDSRIV